MKNIGLIAAIGSAIALSGCAASYVKYDVNGTDSCPPYVRADTAMGVSVSVNETCSLDKLKKPKQTNEQGGETVNE
ncbi:TPA: hypothetical protein L3N15_004219 [Vibrio parahaemolyticus]|uniref:hypothetical protein n=1 Tax=Vibrio parahaemolyticus TaxID=670 RepID=UPI000C9A77DA|nr:hypothetical protein [Vibrio parahaemolyticus]PMS91982.1 hypothetical protein C1T06_23105 [Vibrio parahaemolyticus]HBN6266237.1 hypothetical protein [Vibrio parahaemolyticus]